MARITIDSVFINSVNSAFGGKIFSFEYLPGVGGEKTRLQIHFVNESGKFNIPDPSIFRPYKIKMGNVVDSNFYVIGTIFRESSNGRVLIVDFQDISFILDRYWVGLNKKMGDSTEKTNLTKGNLILVGKENHPCDVDGDGIVSATDLLDLAYDQDDPCELKCPNSTSQREPLQQICQEREVTEIFDVNYNFSDLLTAIKTIIPVANVPQDINNEYFERYTGKLSQVLANWMQDFGWTYFFENDKLNFIDISKRVKINFPTFNNTLSTETRKTLEGTVSRGSISYYAEPGIFAQQDCSTAEAFNLRCLTLYDLFGNYYKPSKFAVAVTQSDQPITEGSLGPALPPDEPQEEGTQTEYKDDVYPDGVNIDSFEGSCVCAFYSQRLRDSYNFFNYYRIVNSTAANTLIGKNLDRLGQMKLIKVCDETNFNTDIFQYLLNEILPDGKVLFETLEEKLEFIKRGGYFALGFFDDELLQKQYIIEEQLAKEFMGIHWIRPYAGPFMGESPQISPQGSYFGALSTPIKQVPFTKFHHSYRSYVGKATQSFIQIQKNFYRTYNQFRFTAPQAQQINKKIVKSILYVSKTAVWNPLETTRSDFKNLLEDKLKSLFAVVDLDVSLLPEEILSGEEISSELKKKLKLMIFYPDTLNVETSFETNKFEDNPSHAEDIEPYKLLTYGLTSKRCVQYTIGGVKILTPAAASTLFKTESNFAWLLRLDQVATPSVPQYKVLVSNTTRNRGIVPKVQSVLIKRADNSKNTMNVEYIARSINRGSVKYINKLTAPNCVLPTDLIEQVHNDFSKNLDYSVDEPFESKIYEIAGSEVSSPISIRKGLESVSVRIDNQGIFTSIKIGNSLFIPKGENLLTRKLEFEQNDYYLANNRPPPF